MHFIRTTLLVCLAAALAATASEVTLRGDKTILIDGKPFFPLGMYHVSWAGDDARRLDDLREIAAAGFNTMHPATGGKDSDFFDEAQRLGVRLIVECNDPDGTPAVIKKLRDKPCLLGWLIADDADNGKKTPDQILKLHKEIKAIDPQHLTYLSCGYPKKCSTFMNSADLAGMQTYPVPDEEVSSTDYSLSAAVALGTPHRAPILANLQSFAWKDKRAPTPSELRVMTHLALIDGVKGILYYTYLDPSWDMRKNPEMWAALKELVPEITRLMPMLLDGKHTKLNMDDEFIFAATWLHNGETYVSVVNTALEAKEATISLPEGSVTAQALFAQRPSGLTVKDGNLRGGMGALEAHVYKIGTTR